MRSPIIFRVFKGDQIQFVKQFTDKEQVIIGKTDDPSQVDIQLDEASVTGIHCLVERRGDQFYICDLGSTVGVLKNGNPVIDEVINSGDEIVLGPYKLVFMFMGAARAQGTTVQETAPVAPVAAAPVAPVQPKVEEAAPKAEPVVIPDSVVETKPEPVAPPAPALVQEVKPVAPVAAKPAFTAATVVRSASAKAASTLFRKKSKGQKSEFTPSAHSHLKEFIRPGKGNTIQVIVSWKGRVLDTKNFNSSGTYKAGPGQDIQLPEGAVMGAWTLLSGSQIQISGEMKAEVNRNGEVFTVSETNYSLQQGEVVYVYLQNGMELAVRFVDATALVPLDSPIILTSSELTGILAALIIATLMSLLVSVLKPKDVPKEEDVERVAQVIFNKPPPPPTPKPPAPVIPEEKPPEQVQEKPKPPEQKKQVVIADKQQEQQNKGNPKLPDQKSQQAQKAGRASEVAPKDPKLKAKIFTSTKQGGSIKTGDTAGANAKSKDPDPTNSGLLAAFGSGGARSKLDKAYSGSGELLGAGEKATGSSGFNEDRAGDDLGSKFKDTGAGGKGTATAGIAGVGTKGRGTGMSAYGSGNGLGAKDQVAIQAGGSEEEFVGSIDREAVRRAVRSAMSAFKACYEREYKKDTKLEGKVMISWEIHEQGVARNSKVVKDKTTLGNSAVENCVRDRMLAIRFPEPPPGTIAEVMYPFVFQGQQ